MYFKIFFGFLCCFSYLFSEGPCAFCNDEILEKQTFYEDEYSRALYTHKPIFEGHCLIIPKRHVERFEDLSQEEYQAICQTIKKVDLAVADLFKTSSYLILQKNGVEVGQTVPHVHFHYIPRESGDKSVIKFLAKMFITNWYSPISSDEMKKVTEKIRDYLKS